MQSFRKNVGRQIQRSSTLRKHNLIRKTENIFVTMKNNYTAKLQKGQCILDNLKIRKDRSDSIPLVYLHYNELQNQVHLNYLTAEEGYKECEDFYSSCTTYSLKMEHSDDCPARLIEYWVEEKVIPKPKGEVRVAAVLAILDSENKVLITRRRGKLGSFPRAWVMPGGGIDQGETLEEGVMREILEETGVKIDRKFNSIDGKPIYYHLGHEVVLEPYYLYESIWKGNIMEKCPRTHHIVLFYYVKLNVKGEDFKLKIDPNEVDAAAWLTPNLVSKIMNFQNAQFGVICPKMKGGAIKDIFQLERLFPVYPNHLDEGLGRGHYTGLRHLFQNIIPHQIKDTSPELLSVKYVIPPPEIGLSKTIKKVPDI